MDKNEQRTLLNLLPENSYITAAVLAKQIHVSEKTLRCRLHELRTEIENTGVQIEMKKGSGFRLQVNDRQVYEEWQKMHLKKEENSLPQKLSERINYILIKLINTKEYITREEFAQQMYVSDKTISNDLRRVEYILLQYKMKLEKRPNYGIKISGTEFSKRQCLVNHFLMQEDYRYFDDEIQEQIGKIGDILYCFFKSHQVQIPELSFKNLVLYSYISVMRNREKFYAEDWKNHPQEHMKHIEKEYLYFAKEIISDLQTEEWEIQNTEPEIHFLAVYIMGSRVNCIAHYNRVIPERIRNLSEEMLESIWENRHVDFRDDLDLRMMLNQHLIGFDVRMNYGILLNNPILDELKSKYLFSYALAQEACIPIRRAYGKKVSDDEMGYFAILIEMALSYTQKELKQKNILLVCGTGRTSAQFMKFQLQKEFENNIGDIKLCNIFELQNIDFKKYDYVFSTVAIDSEIPLPIVMIHDFPNEKEMNQLHKQINGVDNTFLTQFYRSDRFFAHVRGSDKKTVIHDLCKQVERNYKLPKGFEESVMKREMLGSTDFGNLVAIPHTLDRLMNETFVAVGILEKPILWERNEVQLIVLTSIGNSEDENVQRYYKVTSDFLMNSDMVKTVIDSKNYEVLLDQLNLALV